MAGKATRRIRTKNEIKVVEDQTSSTEYPRPSVDLLFEEVVAENVTELEIQQLIDNATEWDIDQKMIAGKVTQAKKLLLAHAKENEWKDRAGETGACKIGPSSKTTILATALARVLKLLGKVGLFDDLVSVRLGEARKYLGEMPLESISTTETKEYGTVTLKPLRK